jgi:hypothetical protein
LAGARENPQCNDGVDNDGDGLVDLADPRCSDPSDDDERAPLILGGGCGVGPELAVLVPALWLLRRRRARAS